MNETNIQIVLFLFFAFHKYWWILKLLQGPNLNVDVYWNIQKKNRKFSSMQETEIYYCYWVDDWLQRWNEATIIFKNFPPKNLSKKKIKNLQYCAIAYVLSKFLKHQFLNIN